MRFSRLVPVVFATLLALPGVARAIPITVSAGDTASGNAIVTFAEFEPLNPGDFVYHSGLLTSGTVVFGERFAGQTRTSTELAVPSGCTPGIDCGSFDVLAGIPSGPLTPLAGTDPENLIVINLTSQFANSESTLIGIGPAGDGGGSIAMLFPTDQRDLGITIFGSDGGAATFDFFRRDGSLLGSLAMPSLADGAFTFSNVGNAREIAGVSVWNADFRGIAFDRIVWDSTVVAVPQAGSLLLLGFGVLTMSAAVRKRRQRSLR